MKERASFTFDKKTLEALDRVAKLGRYRNKSHIVEEAIKMLEKEVRKDDKKE